MACFGCGCFKRCRPRYKRHVDSIFPPNPDDGIVSSNMEKLTFYALSAPEKLDRIGTYLAQRLSRDIQRHRAGYVFIAMKALDELLKACHAPSLNLFVESFLTMVQLLLESSQPDFQQLATRSFMTFANIEEDTPSYHRRYDFFISKFSAMCFHHGTDERLKSMQRLSGLHGLQGVIRKTVSDDLQKNIWESTHMGKIVPALLINMQAGSAGTSNVPATGISLDEDESHPSKLAELCLRDLVGRAGFGHLKSVLRPLFRFLDEYQAWMPNDFAKFTMHTVMFSVQSQYTYMVVLMLLEHLDTIDISGEQSLQTRTSVVQVLGATIALADGSSLGPSHLDVFNTLLRQLRLSIDKAGNDSQASETGQLQESITVAVGKFAKVLPGYAQSDVMKFIVGKLPPPGSAEGDVDGVEANIAISRATSVDGFNLYREMLVKCIAELADAYKPSKLSTALAPSFFEPLLKHCLVARKEVRLSVLRILHKVIDISGNVEHLPKALSCNSLATIKQGHLSTVKDMDVLREDELYFKRHGAALLQQLYAHATLPDNDVDVYMAVYETLTLLCIELGPKSSLVDITRMVLALQDFAVDSRTTDLGPKRISSLHSVVALFMHFGVLSSENSVFRDCVDKVVSVRNKEAPHLLPDTCFSPTYTWENVTNPTSTSHLLFQRDQVSAALAADMAASRYTRRDSGLVPDTGPQKQSASDATSIVNLPTSKVDAQSSEHVSFTSIMKSMETTPEKPALLPTSFEELTEEALRRNADAQMKFQELVERLAQNAVSQTLTAASTLALPAGLSAQQREAAAAAPWKFSSSHEDLTVF
ncbi:protein EFR3 homolog A-like [Sycon ciliatum]|uniref:protein EFR3 homolog A-like n=1 Tax=Sycon ciliatum TaxID=27933 RepID=UPI0031F67E7F